MKGKEEIVVEGEMICHPEIFVGPHLFYLIVLWYYGKQQNWDNPVTDVPQNCSSLMNHYLPLLTQILLAPRKLNLNRMARQQPWDHKASGHSEFVVVVVQAWSNSNIYLGQFTILYTFAHQPMFTNESRWRITFLCCSNAQNTSWK